ncbi:thiol-activated cytolysin family protein [Sphingobacterium faecium]|uniref:thiol-activated cytolysin family protein n=1 Tax=Sphingobacterium faecium TaxID=34087 RepID=UPI003DA24BBA
MKKALKCIILMSLAIVLATSCSKTKDLVGVDSSKQNELKKINYKPTVINLSAFDKESFKSLANRKKQNSLTYLRDSIWANDGGKSFFYETTEIPAVLEETRRKLYLGAIIKGTAALDIDNFVPLQIAASYRNPITMYANFPTDSIYRTVMPSKIQDLSYLRAALKAGSGIQIQSFSYEQSQFRKTEELKKSFGANLNLGKILTVDYLDTLSNSQFNTLVRAEFTQENFSINIEPPIYEPFLKPNFNLSIFEGVRPLIVSSVTYGRKGIFIMESDSSYNMVKNTLAVALTLSAELLGESSESKLGPAFSAELKARLTKEQTATLQNSRMKVYIIGADGRSIVQAVTGGLAGFAKVLSENGNFTPESPGDILYYSLNYLDDFETFRNRFQINVAN